MSSTPGLEGRITVLIVLIRPAVYANLYRLRRTLHTAAVVYIYIHVGMGLLSYDLTLPSCTHIYINIMHYTLLRILQGYAEGQKGLLLKQKQQKKKIQKKRPEAACTAVAAVHGFSFDTLLVYLGHHSFSATRDFCNTEINYFYSITTSRYSNRTFSPTGKLVITQQLPDDI